MISEIIILSARGEPLVHKEYRYDTSSDSKDMFFKKIQDGSKSSTLPHLKEGGIHFFHIKRNGLYFVATSMHEISPILIIELLSRFHHVCKDYCGLVNEDSIRSNMILIYELLDEIVDFGCIQLTTTDKLKPFIQSEPVIVQSERVPESAVSGLFGIEHRVAPNNAAAKPVIRSRADQEVRRHEIFLDVIERMTVLLSAQGSVINAVVNGELNMKSFLMGSPDIKLGLNEDLTAGREDKQKGFGSHAHLDDFCFHGCVKLDEFEETRVLTIRPPEGEFSVMKYSIQGELPRSLPFRLFSYIDDADLTRDMEVVLKLHCDIPSACQAVNLTVKVPLPKSTTGITQQLSGAGQTAEFKSVEKMVEWKINKFPGQSDVSARFKLIVTNRSKASRMELGPVALQFEISSYVCSNLQVRFLRVFDREHSYVPLRWVRYITVTDSYVFKV